MPCLARPRALSFAVRQRRLSLSEAMGRIGNSYTTRPMCRDFICLIQHYSSAGLLAVCPSVIRCTLVVAAYVVLTKTHMPTISEQPASAAATAICNE
jgi:hypothetical protein